MVQKNAGNTTSLLLDLQSALDRLDPLQKAQAIEQMFGKFQFARISALLNNLGRQGSQTLQVLDLMKASTADLEQVASRELSMVTESAAGRYKRALESLKANLADVGEEFLKIGTFIVSVLDKIITFGQKLPDPLKKLIAFGTAFTAMVGPVIMLTGLLANFFGYIVNAQLERDLGIAVTSYAQSTGRSIDLTKVPMVDQPVVDARGSSNMRALFRRGRFRGILQALGRATRTRTMGAPYSIETTIPPRFNSGGLVYSPSSGQAIVPGPQSVNYDIVPANVPLGGFVLNQAATRNNPDLARMAGSGYGAGGKTTPVMLTPGEAVFSPEFTAANYELLSAANSGMKIKFHNTGGFVS